MTVTTGKLPVRRADKPFRFGRMLMLFWVTLALSAFQVQAQATDATLAPGQARMSEQEANEAIDRLKEIATDAENWARAFPSSHLRLEPVLEQCDYDPVKIFQWIGTETVWVPYQGSLRGARGVLMDRRGNSLDRSHLLAQLLLEAGFEARLARSRLNPETARTLLEAQTAATGNMAASVPDKQVKKEVLDNQREVAAQAQDLAAIAGLDGNAQSGLQAEQFLADLTDHWWVQVKDGGDWQDLDPMAADGKMIAGVEKPSILSLDKLPDDVHHRLEIKLVIERWQAGQLVEEVPMSHKFAVDEAPPLSYLEMGFMPFSEEWVSLDNADEGLSAVQIADTSGFWRPYLKLNGEFIRGKWFNASGNLEAPVKRANVKKLSAANAALSALGGKPPEKAPETFLTAAWFEYVTTDPGNRGERVRREIFDLLGQYRHTADIPGQLTLTSPLKRNRGLALLSHTSGLVLNSTPHPEAVDQFAFDTFVRNKNVFISLVYIAAGWGDDKRVPIAMGRADFRPIDLMAMAALRNLWSRHGDHIYIDRINLLSSHLIRPIEDDGEATKFAPDIVINHVGVAPGAPQEPRLARLEQGVLDTLVETRFSRSEESFNTFRHFQARSKGAKDWIPVTGTAMGTALPKDFPAADSGRMMAAAKNGDVVVASPAVYEFGGHRFASWWQVDPDNGTTLGRGYRGWGTEMTETLETETVATRETAPVAKQTGKNVACKVLDAAVGVTVDYAAEWALQEAAARAAGRGALIDKIKAAAPRNPDGTHVYDDLPEWCK